MHGKKPFRISCLLYALGCVYDANTKQKSFISFLVLQNDRIRNVVSQMRSEIQQQEQQQQLRSPLTKHAVADIVYCFVLFSSFAHLFLLLLLSSPCAVFYHMHGFYRFPEVWVVCYTIACISTDRFPVRARAGRYGSVNAPYMISRFLFLPCTRRARISWGFPS